MKRPVASSIALVAVTHHGVTLALQLQQKLPGSTCYVPARHRFALAMGAKGFDRLAGIFPEIWSNHDALVCIMATGIVVRLVARLVGHKASDPAVVVLDERGQFAVSLLSGHLGGANLLAKRVARLTGGQPVVTTASDVQGKPALDLLAREAGLEVENIGTLARVARALLEEEPVCIHDPCGRLYGALSSAARLIEYEAEESDPMHGAVGQTGGERPACGIWVCESVAPRTLDWLELRPLNLVVGIGCNRGTSAEEVLALARTVFQEEGLSLLSVRNLVSIDLKSDEAGIHEAARMLDRPVVFYSRQEIEHVAVPNPSRTVATHVGVHSVCEATALLNARANTLLVPKQKTRNVTLAVARADCP